MAGKRTGLVRARKAAGYTQEQFASKLGVDRSTIHRWENASTAPLAYLHPKIAGVLRLSLSDLEALLSEPVGAVPDWDCLAKSSDSAIEADLRILIDIAVDGAADVRYWHGIHNLSKLPMTRLRRDLWFERAAGQLEVTPISDIENRLMIQSIHATSAMAKFACQLAPPIQPGGFASFGYRCTGGVFADRYYWREVVTRYTRRCSIEVTQQGARRLTACNAVVEHPDGRENSAAENLEWHAQDGVVALGLRQEYLSPNHAIALRWDIERHASA